MSTRVVYDNWERLVKAVVDREKIRHLAFCPSFSSSDSASRCSSFDSLHVDTGGLNEEIQGQTYLKIYSFLELKVTTNNFKSEELGCGSFGTVYKGWVDHPSKFGTWIMVAIKRWNPDGFQGLEQWQSELYCGRLLHPNFVKLLGYCREDKELLLVYEFMQKGSLDKYLFKRDPSITPLTWDLRLKVAIGVATGLDFLHTSEKKIIYRDVNPYKILLDESYNAKIADFGLATLGPTAGESYIETTIMGTYGYAAPEYVGTGFLYVKSDVYGFGVVLLELLTGLRVLDKSRKEHANLVDWMKPSLKRKTKAIMDQRIAGQYSSKAAQHAAKLVLSCLEQEPGNRPSMKEVIGVLEKISAIEKPKGPRSRPFLLPQIRQFS